MPDDPFVAEIFVFPFNFAPVGYAMCQGQLLPINQNQALFSLIGTFYGGNGQSTFALPNLQGAVPIGAGQGAGLSVRVTGETGGSEAITLTTAKIPQHTHALSAASVGCRNGAGNSQTPASNVPAAESTGVTAIYGSAAPDAAMRTGNVAVTGTGTMGATGADQPHENRQPYLTFNYCIALQGVYPPRS